MDPSSQDHKKHRPATTGAKSLKKRDRKKHKGVPATEGDAKRNPRAFFMFSAASAGKLMQRAADRENKRLHVPIVDRSGDVSVSDPPYLVAVVGPSGVGKTTLIRCLVKHYTKHSLGEIRGPVTVVSGKKRRLTFMECPNELNAMIDVAKVADLVLLVIDAAFGYEMETFEFLNVVQVHGFPKIMGVLTHLDGFKISKTVNRRKKELKHRFWSEIYDGAKLFYLSGIRYGKYLKKEIQNLARFISVIKFRPLVWRNTHPSVYVDRVEDISDPDIVRRSPAADRRILMFGYLRGTYLKSKMMVHIPGVGDMYMKEVTAMPDPCALPEEAKKRGLNEKETLLYAPMTDVGDIMFDKDAMYINIKDDSLRYSEIGLPVGSERLGATNSTDVLMMKQMQNASYGMDEKIKKSHIQLFGHTNTSNNSSDDGDSEDDCRSHNGIREAREMGKDGRIRRRAVFDSEATLNEDDDDDNVDYDRDNDDDSDNEDSDGGKEESEDGNEDEEDEEDEEGEEGEDGEENEAASRWKDNMAAKAAARFLSAPNVMKLVYGEVGAATGNADNSGPSLWDTMDAEQNNDDDDDELFRRKVVKQMEGGVDIDGVDSSKYLLSSVIEKEPKADGLGIESNSDVKRYSRRFVDGSQSDEPVVPFSWLPSDSRADWVQQLQARFAAKFEIASGEGGNPNDVEDDNAEEVFGDFEDLEAADGGSGGESHENKEQQKLKDELQLKKLSKKAAFDAEYDEGGAENVTSAVVENDDVDDGVIGENDGLAGDLAPGRKKSNDPVTGALTKSWDLNKTAFALEDPSVRAMYEGLPPGTYVRIEFESIPCEFSTFFNPRWPVLVGGLLPTEEKMGVLHMRVKKHRWHKKILKTNDPLVFSIGWRRYQSLPLFYIEDINGRRRMLKYTPDHMHCVAAVYGPVVPQNTGVMAFQSLSASKATFRVSATGYTVETDATVDIVKKLKLTGTPYKIFKNTAFIKDMFHSSLEIAKFEGARLRTVSGIRGSIKKALKQKGCFRATFEDKILMSDIVFLRAWVPIEPKMFYNPLTTHLAKTPVLPKSRRTDTHPSNLGKYDSEEEEQDGNDENEEVKDVIGLASRGLDNVDHNTIDAVNGNEDSWARMRTVAELRRSLGIAVPANPDSEYRPIERETRRFNTLNLPKRLEAALPFASKPKKDKPKPSKAREKEKSMKSNGRIRVLEPNERKEIAMMQMLNTVRNEKEEKRQRAKAESRARVNKMKLVEEEGKAARIQKEKKRKFSKETASAQREVKRQSQGGGRYAKKGGKGGGGGEDLRD